MSLRERLDNARAELARQEAVEQAATPGPWPLEYVHEAVRHISRNCGDMMPEVPEGSEFCFRWGYYVGEYGGHNDPPVIVQSRNLNPARLRVAREMLDSAEPWADRRDVYEISTLDIAEDLLGLAQP